MKFYEIYPRIFRPAYPRHQVCSRLRLGNWMSPGLYCFNFCVNCFASCMRCRRQANVLHGEEITHILDQKRKEPWIAEKRRLFERQYGLPTPLFHPIASGRYYETTQLWIEGIGEGTVKGSCEAMRRRLERGGRHCIVYGNLWDMWGMSTRCGSRAMALRRRELTLRETRAPTALLQASYKSGS